MRCSVSTLVDSDAVLHLLSGAAMLAVGGACGWNPHSIFIVQLPPTLPADAARPLPRGAAGRSASHGSVAAVHSTGGQPLLFTPQPGRSARRHCRAPGTLQDTQGTGFFQTARHASRLLPMTESKCQNAPCSHAPWAHLRLPLPLLPFAGRLQGLARCTAAQAAAAAAACSCSRGSRPPAPATCGAARAALLAQVCHCAGV